MRNRVFFPQGALDEWLVDGRVELTKDELVLKSEGRRYRIIEAVRVLREVTGTEDVSELIGRVKTVAFLTELGAEILQDSMVLGDNAYDIVPGFVGAPAPPPANARRMTTPQPLGREKSSDEELLARFLTGKSV